MLDSWKFVATSTTHASASMVINATARTNLNRRNSGSAFRCGFSSRYDRIVDRPEPRSISSKIQSKTIGLTIRWPHSSTVHLYPQASAHGWSQVSYKINWRMIEAGCQLSIVYNGI